jgi:DNA invertase Pin-like site-specific DNA recombinase
VSPPERIYFDKRSEATTDRPGLWALLDYARANNGHVIVVHTLDRLGRTVRDTLNLIYELSERARRAHRSNQSRYQGSPTLSPSRTSRSVGLPC